MAAAVSRAGGVPTDGNQSSTEDPRVAPEAAPKQRTSEVPLNYAEKLVRPLCHILRFDNCGRLKKKLSSLLCEKRTKKTMK